MGLCGRFTVVSIQSRFDTSRFDANRSKFVTNVKSIRYKLTLLQIVSIPNTILERTQTFVVNKTNPYLREPPHVPVTHSIMSYSLMNAQCRWNNTDVHATERSTSH